MKSGIRVYSSQGIKIKEVENKIASDEKELIGIRLKNITDVVEKKINAYLMQPVSVKKFGPFTFKTTKSANEKKKKKRAKQVLNLFKSGMIRDLKSYLDAVSEIREIKNELVMGNYDDESEKIGPIARLYNELISHWPYGYDQITKILNNIPPIPTFELNDLEGCGQTNAIPSAPKLYFEPENISYPTACVPSAPPAMDAAESDSDSEDEFQPGAPKQPKQKIQIEGVSELKNQVEGKSQQVKHSMHKRAKAITYSDALLNENLFSQARSELHKKDDYDISSKMRIGLK